MNITIRTAKDKLRAERDAMSETIRMAMNRLASARMQKPKEIPPRRSACRDALHTA
jgi:hypothetical protein